MLIIGTRDDPALVVGNECLGYAVISQVPVRTVLYQNFSLMGQDRGTGAPLADILADEGIGAGSCVGVIGWKVYDEPGVAAPETWIDAPLQTCEKRDPKGLYKKARAGLIKNFTGIDDPYEAPENAEVVLKSADISPEEAARQVLEYLESKNCF